MTVFILLSSSGSVAAEPTDGQGSHRLLRTQEGLSGSEFKELDQGRVVTKALENTTRREIIILGVVRIDVPRKFFLKNYMKEGMNLETVAAESGGKFSDFPEIGDVRELTMPPEELLNLADCREGECKVKATSELMSRFRCLDKAAPDFEDQGNRLMRQELVEYVRKYLRDGDGALFTYCDKPDPVQLADEYRDLFLKSPYTRRYAPETADYFRSFPHRKYPNARDAIYWIRENLGNKTTRPLTSITHLVFFQGPETGGDLVTASKQLYATHYFEAALGLTLMGKDLPGEGPGFRLIHINHVRIDILREVPGFLAKHLTRGVHELLEKRLGTVKNRMEEAYRMDRILTLQRPPAAP